MLDEPLIMVAAIDEKDAAKRAIPSVLLHSVKEIDVIRMRIRAFFTIRYMVFHLTQNDGQAYQRL